MDVAVIVSAIVCRVASGLLSIAVIVSFLLYLFDKAPFMWPLFWWAVAAWVATIVLALIAVVLDD